MNQSELLFEIFKLINEKKVCPETSMKEWVTLLLYLHCKGWLYSSVDKDNNIKLAVAMYRIPEINKKYIDVLPKEEQGNILYIPFYVSDNGNNFTALKLLKQYLKHNKEKIKEVAFHERGDNNKLKRFKVNREVING